MPFKQDESFKELIDAIGKMMDARFETFAINFRAEMQEEFKKICAEMATKDDIKNMETKDDIKRLEDKIDKRDKQYEERFAAIETAHQVCHKGN